VPLPRGRRTRAKAHHADQPGSRSRTSSSRATHAGTITITNGIAIADLGPQNFAGGAISSVVHLGRELAIDEPMPADTIGPSAMGVRWSGCGETPLLLVLRAAGIDLDRGDVVDVLCRVEDDGEFTIPAEATRLIDPAWRAELSLARTIQRTHAIEGSTLFAQARTVVAIELGTLRTGRLVPRTLH